MTEDSVWMKAALREAEKAALSGEVPVGCVIVKDGKIVSRGRNRREKGKDALLHQISERVPEAYREINRQAFLAGYEIGEKERKG